MDTVVPVGAQRAPLLIVRKSLPQIGQSIRSNKSDPDLLKAKGIILSVAGGNKSQPNTFACKSKEQNKPSLPKSASIPERVVPECVSVNKKDDQNKIPLLKSLNATGKSTDEANCSNPVKKKDLSLNVPVALDLHHDDDNNLSEDEFQPKRPAKLINKNVENHVDSICLKSKGLAPTVGNPPKSRKKQGVRTKASEVDAFIAEVEEKNMNTESFIKVHDMMPSSASYIVESCESVNEAGTQWNACVRANICTKQVAYEWLREFEELNSMDFRVRDVKPENSDRLVFKRVYRCHHNTMPRAKPSSSETPSQHTKKKRIINSKNTDCPASVSITIKQTTMKWSSDMLLKKYPCVIKVNHCHNHPVYAADALRRRRPSPKTKQKFIDMLKNGHSPLSAIECHKVDLKMEHGHSYFKVAADASICPSNFWVYKLFTKLSIEGYGPQCGDKMVDALTKFCNNYNTENDSICCKVQLVDNDHLVVAICTPLMKRVHKLIKASSEMMFVDSSGSMDSLNCRVFLMLTSSVVGGLPLGVLITTSESEKVVSSALELWKTLLPEKAFYGRGASVGPKLIMTDDATPERNALQWSFKTCTLLLCLFHVLQAFWRFVWAREQNVPKDKRSQLFYIFKDLVYAENEKIFASRLKDAMDNVELNKYPKVKTHLQKYIPRASEWAVCMRLNLITRGNNTDNLCEAGIKIVKDKTLKRLKAFNPVQLCDFILTRYDNYLQNRIIDVINNRAINQVKSRFYIRPEKLTDLECEELERPNTYCVKNLTKGTTYYVVMDFEICSCEAGKSGNPCKHLCAVVTKYKLTSTVIHPILQCDNPAMKKVLFEVAHGHSNFPEGWFASLISDNSNAETIQEPPQGNLEAEEVLVECSDHVDEESSNVGKEISPEVLQEAEMALSEIFSSWSSQLKTDPAIFLGPIQSFIKNNETVSKSQSSLLSAMHCFGKSTGVSAIGVRKKNLSNIPVQTTAPARRKIYIGGRTAQFSGRPPKAMTAVLDRDHCYGNTQKGNKTDEPTYAHLPRRPRIAAPHNLQLCVETSRMVGK